jgi:simple sugar transport system ATP-binding protein
MSGSAVESVRTAVPVVEARAITKRYGALTALQDVHLSVYPGEIVGLVGDNGAGKSTLVKVLSGALRPTAGELYVDGQQAIFHSPLDARRQGIETVYQDLALAPDLTVTENLFIGRELKRSGPLRLLGTLDRRRMNRHAGEQLDRLRVRIDSVTIRAESLSGGQRQAIAVARAVAWGRRILLMDEPTASLAVEEQRKVAELIEEVRRGGTPVLLVSHNIPQVHEICDRIVVLLHGRAVADLKKDEVGIEDVVMWITGVALKARGGGGS